MENEKMKETDQPTQNKKLYVAPVKSVYADGTHYVDGERLHELLMEQRGKKGEKISDELAIMISLIVDNILLGLNYKRYTSEWREVMRFNAMYHLIRYCHSYDPNKAKIRREELNATRKKPLSPIPNSKIAFNYVSWNVNIVIASTIKKLKEKLEKKGDTGLSDTDMPSVAELDESVLNEYSLQYQDRLIEEDDEVDYLAEKRKKELESRIDRYAEAALEVARKHIEAHPKSRKKVRAYMITKWGVDIDTGKPCLENGKYKRN